MQEDSRRGFIPQPGNRVRFVVAMALVLGASLAVRAFLIPGVRWKDWDEGLHALLAQLLAAGYKPYSQLFVSYPPMFVWSMQLPWQVWGRIEALQWVAVAYSLLGVAAVGFIANWLNGWLAGFVAAFVLSFAPRFLTGSSQVMVEVPSVGLAAVGMALAVAAYGDAHEGAATTRRRRWLLFASGLITCASLMLKIMTPFMLALIPLMILAEHWGNSAAPPRNRLQAALVDGLAWTAGGLVLVAVSLVAYDPRAMFDQVIAFRFNSRLAENSDTTNPLGLVTLFLFHDNQWLILAAVWGVMLRPRNLRSARYVWLWLMLAVAFMLIQVPLRLKHLPLLVPPVAILAGIGVAEGARRISRIELKRRPWLAVVSIVVTAGLTLGYAWQFATQLPAFDSTAWNPLDYFEVSKVEDLMARYTTPTDCVVTDWPHLPFLAGRPVPPSLSELSYSRLQSGNLTCDDVIKATEESACQVVVPLAYRVSGTCRSYVDWARVHFLRTWNFSQKKEAFLLQPLAQPAPDHALDVTFGDGITLIGYDLVRQVTQAGQALYLSLYWRPTQPVPDNYTILVEARDQADRVVVRGDHEPFGGLVRTKTFRVNQTVKDTVRLDLPSDSASGDLSLYCGLASAKTSVRLPLSQGAGGENLLRVATIEGRPPQ